MWLVLEHRHLGKSIRKAPKETRMRYEAWKRIVEVQGPLGLRGVKGFHDEALKGNWKGFRSSRLGIKWRIIYLVRAKELVVYAAEINPHNY